MIAPPVSKYVFVCHTANDKLFLRKVILFPFFNGRSCQQHSESGVAGIDFASKIHSRQQQQKQQQMMSIE